MRISGIHVYVLALTLAAPLPVPAVTDTWDGGGINDFFLTSANWADNTAPASDLLGTDIVFEGALRRIPILISSFSAHRITFDDSALSFAIQGAELSVGVGGIINENAATMSFNTPVTFIGGNTPIHVSGGPEE
jgi:hypothetical protein